MTESHKLSSQWLGCLERKLNLDFILVDQVEWLEDIAVSDSRMEVPVHQSSVLSESTLKISWDSSFRPASS